MNLAKIFDLVRCSRNNISCDANTLTLDDARRKYADYQYAIVNALNGIYGYTEYAYKPKMIQDGWEKM